MARAPIVRIDGNELRGIVEVHWAIRAQTTHDHEFSRRGFITTGVTLRRVIDTDDTLAEWASDFDDVNRRAGEIEFRDPSMQLEKALSWTGGWIADYRVEFNPASGHTEEVARIQIEDYRLRDRRHDHILVFRPNQDLLPSFETCKIGEQR